MKIVFTGGGTGGHFYPLIAIAESVRVMARESQLIAPRFFYLAPSAFDEDALFENEIVFIKTSAGKMRRYFSLLNVSDLFKTFFGFIQACVTLLRIYPDVIVSKGGYASVPVVLAGALLRIPILIHESDIHPGRANTFASKFAYKIAVTFPQTASDFGSKNAHKIALTGVPIRHAIALKETHGAKELLSLDTSVKTILILGGSSGSQKINDAMLGALPELVPFANIIHQTGRDSFTKVKALAEVILEKNTDLEKSRYHPLAYLNVLSMRRAAGAADLVISRAGMTAITEIALWNIPSIIVPIPESISHDQKTNAYYYAQTGAALVIEEHNLTPHILASEIKRLLTNDPLLRDMAEKSTLFAKENAADIIAEEIIRITLSHEEEASR